MHTTSAAQAAPAAVPGNGNGNGHGNSQAGGQGQGQGQAGGGPAVVWATRQISNTLAPGGSVDVTATFTVSRTLTNVTVRLTGNPRGAITVTPSTFASLVPGQTYSVQIHLAAPATGQRGAYATSLQLRQGHRNLGQPLNVHLKVNRPDTGDDND